MTYFYVRGEGVSGPAPFRSWGRSINPASPLEFAYASPSLPPPANGQRRGCLRMVMVPLLDPWVDGAPLCDALTLKCHRA